jgi:phage shock protein PspC (stress-responsive transcriptional regulator)
MNRLNLARRTQIINCLVEGNSDRFRLDPAIFRFLLCSFHLLPPLL